MSRRGCSSLAQLARMSGTARGIALLGKNRRCWGRTGEVGRFRLGRVKNTTGRQWGCLKVLGAFSVDCPQDGVQMVAGARGTFWWFTGSVVSEDVPCVSSLCGLFSTGLGAVVGRDAVSVQDADSMQDRIFSSQVCCARYGPNICPGSPQPIYAPPLHLHAHARRCGIV